MRIARKVVLTVVVLALCGAIVQADGPDADTLWGWGSSDSWLNGFSMGDATGGWAAPNQLRGVEGAPGTSLSGVIAVAGGGGVFLALREDHTVWKNAGSQLEQIRGVGGAGYLTGITAIAVGDSHYLALHSDGTVYAWGYNDQGQLGDGTRTYSAYPVHVRNVANTGNLANVTAIAAGDDFSLAVSNGYVVAWGYNGSGQLGTSSDSDHAIRDIPIYVAGSPTASKVAAGGNGASYLLTASGAVYAWGNNSWGGLGNGTPRTGVPATPHHAHQPQYVMGGVTAIAAGRYHCLAIQQSGGVSTVYGWGSNNSGQVGRPKTLAVPYVEATPAAVLKADDQTALTGAMAIAAGDRFSVALKADGTIWTWGRNEDCELGRGVGGDVLEHDLAAPSPYFSNATAIACRGYASLAVASMWRFQTDPGTIDGYYAGGYPDGTVLTLDAVPEEGHDVTEWLVNGATVQVGGTTLELTIDRNIDDPGVEAILKEPVVLTVVGGTLPGGGTSATYHEGDVVAITAEPPAGEEFINWTTSGGASLADAYSSTTDVTLSGSYEEVTVTAHCVPILIVQVGLDRDWVYQNTPVTTEGRHHCVLTVAVSGHDSYEMLDIAWSGDGVVEMSQDDTFTWTVAGGWRQTNGIDDTGTVTITVSVWNYYTDEVMTAETTLTVRQLGDIDGYGGVNGQDKLLLNQRLNGLVPDGPQYDLDGVGGCNGQDKLLLNKILNGLPIP